MKYAFDASAARRLPESYDYGVFAQSGVGIIGTAEQRLEFAQRMHRLPKNGQEYIRACRTILQGQDAGLVEIAAVQWPTSPDVLAEWNRLDDNASKEEVSDGLPSKAKLGRDVYNLGLDTSIDPDDRIKAFRLFAEVQGHIGRGGNTINNNIDARSIILVPRRSVRLDDPEREEKVIQAQARLVSDAVRK
jgi:hypothetical protein